MARLEAVLSADTKRFDAGMARAEGSMSSSQKKMGIASAAIIGGVGLIGVKAVNAAADFEAGLNSMQAVSGATAEQMKMVSKRAIELGNDIKLPGTSAKDAAEAMTELSKSGMSIQQTMKAIRPTLLLSAAAQVSNARAAEITSNALNAFGLDASRTSKIVDVLANTANSSSVEIEDVADSMKMAGAVFKGMQGPAVGAEQALKDLSTAVGILGNAGIKGSDAGTSLKAALLALAAPSNKTKTLMRDLYLLTDGTAEAQRLFTLSLEGSTKEMRDNASSALEKLQGKTKGFGDIAYNAAGKMRSLPEIVDQVTRATAGMTQELRNEAVAQIFGADATRSIIALMDQGQKGWNKMAAAVDKNGAAQELAAAKSKGLKGAQDALQSTLDTLAITFGLVLLPYVTKATQAITKMAGFIGEHQTATMALTGVLLAFGLALGVVAVATKIYHGYVMLTNAATKVWTATQWLLNAALTANPIGLVVAALVLLGAALVVAYKKSETFRDIVKGAMDVVFLAADKVKGLFVWFKDNARAIVTGVITAVTGIGGKIWAVFTEIPTKFTAMLVTIKGWGTGVGSAVKDAAVDAIVGIGSAAWDVVNNIGQWVADKMSTIIGWGTSLASWYFHAIVDGLIGIGAAAWGIINNIWEFVSDRVGQVKGWGSSIATWIKNGLVDGLTGLGKAIWDKIKEAIDWVADHMPSLPKLPDLTPGFSIPGRGSEVGKASLSPTSGVTSALWDEIGLGQGMGLTMTSGLRPGDPGDHGKGKAIDMAGPVSTMATYAMGLMGRAGIKDVIYGGLNFWQDNGRRIGTWAGNEALRGDHYDHVHASVFDGGGWLAPFSKTLAINNTPYFEKVGPPGRGTTVEHHHHYNGPVMQDSKFLSYLRNLDAQFQKRNGGRSEFGS